MQRHGWAFCLGLFATCMAAGQPPADSERYPPAPALPGGTVVSKPARIPSAISVAPVPVRTVSQKPDDLTLPNYTTGPFPYSPTVTATSAPVVPTTIDGAIVVSTPAGVGSSNCPPGATSASCGAKIKQWFHFQSSGGIPGCVPSPYHPSLQAWFPCNPGSNSCDKSPSPGTPIVVGSSVPAATEGESTPAPRQVSDGLRFSPGGAPMAGPTVQANRVSQWKPK